MCAGIAASLLYVYSLDIVGVEVLYAMLVALLESLCRRLGNFRSLKYSAVKFCIALFSSLWYTGSVATFLSFDDEKNNFRCHNRVLKKKLVVKISQSTVEIMQEIPVPPPHTLPFFSLLLPSLLSPPPAFLSRSPLLHPLPSSHPSLSSLSLLPSSPPPPLSSFPPRLTILQ